jgi:hypothetical protein
MNCRKWIFDRQDAYDTAKRKAIKSSIVCEIVQMVQENGRFLERFNFKDQEFWLEVDDVRAKEKVSLCFRSRRRTVKVATEEEEAKKAKDHCSVEIVE